MDILTIIYELAFWLIGFFLLWKMPRCKQEPVSGERGNPKMCDFSVIIPARNEEKTLPHLLNSLAAQSVSPKEIILVNDGSTDATAEVAELHGVRVIPAPVKPGRWSGKSWACWTGARAAAGDVLLFLDADVRLAPSALARLWSTFERDGGLVSVQPYHIVEKTYEQLSSFFNVVAAMGPNCFSILGRRLKPTGAFGPCIMCDRVKYLEIGGHESVNREVAEDIALGKMFKKAGVNK